MGDAYLFYPCYVLGIASWKKWPDPRAGSPIEASHAPPAMPAPLFAPSDSSPVKVGSRGINALLDKVKNAQKVSPAPSAFPET
jgi:hypothetical protein